MTNERRQELEERALIVAQEWQQAGLVQSGKYLVPNIADLLQSIEREVWLKVIKEAERKQAMIIHPGHHLEFHSGWGNAHYDFAQWAKQQQAEVGE